MPTPPDVWAMISNKYYSLNVFANVVSNFTAVHEVANLRSTIETAAKNSSLHDVKAGK